MKIVFLQIDDARSIESAWTRACAGIEPLELAFGPEGRDPRPRPQDTYFLIWDEEHGCGGDAFGLMYTQRPAPTTRAFGMVLFREYRGRGLGVFVRDGIYDFIFSDPTVWKLESEVYSSNDHSLGALHGKHARGRLEGRQVATICIDGKYFDRLLFGLTRPEWEA